MPSESTRSDQIEMEHAIQGLTEVLLAVARGEYGERAGRTHTGDAIDVLAFLVNSTAEEVGELVRQLHAEHEQLQRARDQLILTAKLAALGELAAGVAHELNQPLTAIRMLVDMLRLKPEARVCELGPDFEMIGEAARRMGQIVDGIRTFGRAEPLRLNLTPSERPLLDALALLEGPLRRDNISVKRNVPESLPVIRADGDRLQQVFINLLSNAQDALLEIKDGRAMQVTVEVSSGPQGVCYNIEDNGPGISDDIAARIFDLFFTTKDVGRGTGLGLSISHGIVVEHGGTLRHERGSAGGTRFIVELPVASDRALCARDLNATPGDLNTTSDFAGSSQANNSNTSELHRRPVPGAL